MAGWPGRVVVRGWDAVKRAVAKLKDFEASWVEGLEPLVRKTCRYCGASYVYSHSCPGYLGLRALGPLHPRELFNPRNHGPTKLLAAALIAAVVMVAVVTLASVTGSGKGPAVQSLQCPSGETSSVLTAGLADGFAVPGESASVSAGLMARLGAVKAFDSTTTNRPFAQTFASLPAGITAAELVIGLKPIYGGPGNSDNDTLELSFTDASGSLNPGSWSRYLGSGNASPGLVSSLWRPGYWGSGTTLSLSLALLPVPSSAPRDLISGLNSFHYLDIVVQDDSSVDFVTLNLCLKAPVTPTALSPITVVVGPLPPLLDPPTSPVAASATPTATTPRPTVTASGTPISTRTPTPVPPSTSTPVATTVPCVSNVTFDKSFVPTGIGSIGGHFLFTISNNGPCSIANIQVVDVFPSNLMGMGWSGAPWVCGASVPPKVDCSYAGPLAAGSSVTLVIQPNLSPAPVPPWENCADLLIPAAGQNIVLTDCVGITGPTATPSPTAQQKATPTATLRPTSTPTCTLPGTIGACTPTSTPVPSATAVPTACGPVPCAVQ